MKTAVLKNGKICFADFDIPDLSNKKGAIIKIHGCGLCGSDIVKISHSTPENESKIVLGHEIVGEIVDINIEIKGAKENVPFKKGDIVAMGHHYPCFKCHFCKKENYSMCETFKKVNISPGGFGEFIFASENHLKYTVFKKPDNLSEEEFSFLEPLACCIRAIKRAGEPFGYSLVIGLGSIGLLMAQGAKALGHNVFGMDVNEKRQNFASKLGINFNPDLKYDTIFMTAGSEKAINGAINLAQAGAKIIVFSSIPTTDGYKNNDIYYKELEIKGSYSPSPFDLFDSAKLLAQKKVVVENFSTTYGLFDLEKAIMDTKTGKILKAYIKL